MKKFLCIILAFAMCISMLAFTASSSSGAISETKITEALNRIECVKKELGLSSVDFEDLEYSNPIFAYEYTDYGVQYHSEFIPILYNNTLVGWVIKANAENDIVYQFSTAFVKQVNALISSNANFAFIYDRNSSYLYNGSQLYKLEDISMLVESRALISDVFVLVNSDIELRNFATRYDLHYSSPNINVRTPIYYECGVSFVSQNPPSNLCWAASVASITNYLKKNNYTAVSVAKNGLIQLYTMTTTKGSP